MIVYSLVAGTFLLAFLSIFLLIKGTNRVRSGQFWGLVAGCTLAAFVYLYGTWVYVSVYLKYVFALVALGSMVVAALAAKQPKKQERAPRKWIPYLFSSLVFGSLSTLFFTGTSIPQNGQAMLGLPFKTGRYFVLQGGRGLPTNVMHASKRGAFKYAMDIVKLNNYGNRASAVFTTDVKDYCIFGDTIYSPCSGTVIHAETNNPDNTPPNAIRGKTNTNGVVIMHPKWYVCMVHMKQHSVMVKVGDTVHEGQPIGCVGNSGFSIEPHLHIQAHEHNKGGQQWYLEPPMEMNFNGRSYGLFDIIQAQ